MADPHDNTVIEDGRPLQGKPFDLNGLIGQVFDERYQLDEQVGMGAMGAVFRARQLRLRRTVAVKVPKPEFCSNQEFLARFEREALTMAKLVHENIVQIFDVFVSADISHPSFIAMEFIEGAELEKFLLTQERDLTIAAVVEIFRQIARALDAAHVRGIVHRDIKPSNIVVTMPQRVAKVMDFGIARLEMENVFTTQESQIIGTPAFMSPEQVRGEKAGPPADVYAFAMTMYRLLSRGMAFDAKTQSSLLFAQVNTPPIPVHERNPRLPVELSEALAAGLAKDPAKRPHTAVELAESVGRALKPFESHSFAELFHSSSSLIMPPRDLAKPPVSKKVLYIGLGAAAALVVVVAAAAVMKGGADTKTPGPPTKVETTPVPATPTPRPELTANSTNPVRPERTPRPTPLPVDDPKPTRPLVLEPTPVHKPEPTPVPAATPSPRPTETPEPSPRPAEATPATMLNLKSGDWDPDRFPPETEPVKRNPIRRAVEKVLDPRISKPVYRGQFTPDTDLVNADGMAGGILIDGFRKLQSNYAGIGFSLKVVQADSWYWKDRALVSLQYTVGGRPKNAADPDLQERIFESTDPLMARMKLEGGEWKLVGLEGNLEDFTRTIMEKSR